MTTDLRTPLARARGLGSGKTGTGHFWVQRVTAVALALLVPWLVWVLFSIAGGDSTHAIDVLRRPWNAILMGAFLVATVLARQARHAGGHRRLRPHALLGSHAPVAESLCLHPRRDRVAVRDRPHRADGLSPK
jgi:hypothetical protein